MNPTATRSEISRRDGQWRQMNDQIIQQVEQWMKGCVDSQRRE